MACSQGIGLDLAIDHMRHLVLQLNTHTQKQILFFLACLLLSVFYTRLMRPNKIETGRGLLT